MANRGKVSLKYRVMMVRSRGAPPRRKALRVSTEMEKNMRLTALMMLLAAWTVGATAASAQTPAEPSARFTVQPIDGGILRLDTVTGAVSVCLRRDGNWSCEPVADQAAKSTDIDRLTAQNRALRAEVERLERTLAENNAGAAKPKFELPSEEDVDKAMTYVERLLKKFRERLKDLESSSPPARGTRL
jgi:hypothetical protein